MTHNPGVLTDGLLVIALLLALWGGWRQGAFASVLSTIGVVFGLICGAGLAPKIMGLTDSTALRFLLGAIACENLGHAQRKWVATAHFAV